MTLLRINHVDFNTIFETDLGIKFSDLDLVLQGDCRGLSVSEYLKLTDYLKSLYPLNSSLRQKLDSNALKTLSEIETKYPLKKKQKPDTVFRKPQTCFFFPNSSWSHEDCISWFEVIHFTKYPKASIIKVNGDKIIAGRVSGFIDDNGWKELKDAYDAYLKKFIDSKILREEISKGIKLKEAMVSRPHKISANFLYSEAFEGTYILPSYSNRDFVLTVKEIVYGIPYAPPDRQHPDMKIEYFAPYTTMLQSSMMGKTRFLLTPVKEDDNTRVFVIYFTCLSNIGNVGMSLITMIRESLFSRSITDTQDLLEDVYRKIQAELFDDNNKLKDFYCSVGGVHADDIWQKASTRSNIKGNEKYWCISSDGKRKDVIVAFAIDEAHEMLKDFVADDPKFGYVIPNASDSQALAPNTSARQATPGILGKRVLEETDSQNPPSKMYNLKLMRFCRSCPDDSYDGHYGAVTSTTTSNMRKVSQFTVLRRALRRLKMQKEKCIIPTVLSSTFSKLSNFLPNINRDSSRRVTLLDSFSELHLHRAFLLQEPFDILARGQKVLYPASFLKFLKSEQYIINMMNYGRPCWGRMMSVSLESGYNLEESLITFLQIAEEKLEIPRLKNLTDLDALALFGHCIGVDPFCSNDLASKIVESRLGFLEYVDSINGFIESSFHPEPVFAIMVADILLGENPKLEESLRMYQKATAIGYVDLGNSGEFVARLVLFLCRMLARPIAISLKTIKPLALTKLREFMNCLGKLPKNHRDSLWNEIEADYLDGVVSFTHFIKLKSLKTSGTPLLQQVLARGAAITLPDGTMGVDLIVPLVTASDRLSCVLIQVKNYVEADDLNVANALRKMMLFADLQGFENPLFLIMVITRDTNSKKTIERFAPQTNTALVNSGYKKPPGFIVTGCRFSLRPDAEKEENVFDPVYELTETTITNVNDILTDLADAFRGAKSRLTPKFADFFVEESDIFMKSLDTEKEKLSNAVEVNEEKDESVSVVEVTNDLDEKNTSTPKLRKSNRIGKKK